MSNNLSERVESLLPCDSREWIIGISGGVDSVVLFDICQEYAHHSPREIRLIPVHLNHLTRGEDSDKDEELCRKICAEAGLSLISRRLDVPKIAVESGHNFEETAREERHKLFTEVASELKLARPVILLAHHYDDNQETILMRLLRGSGLRGLKGIQYSSPLPQYTSASAPSINIYRPLYTSTRSEITEYAIRRNLSWREDASNRDTTYTRNLLRRVILPALNLIDPTTGDKLEKISDLALRAENILQKEIHSIEYAMGQFHTYIDEISARQTSTAGFCRIVELICNRLIPGFVLNANSYNTLKQLQQNTITTADITGDIHINLFSGRYYIHKKSITTYAIDYCNTPDRFYYEDDKFSLSIKRTRISGEIPFPDNPNIEYIPLSFSEKELTIRHPDSKQRLIPLGSDKDMRLLKLLKNKGIPQHLRSQLPVLYDNTVPLWIPGVVLCEQARLTEITDEVFCLRYSEKTL